MMPAGQRGPRLMPAVGTTWVVAAVVAMTAVAAAARIPARVRAGAMGIGIPMAEPTTMVRLEPTHPDRTLGAVQAVGILPLNRTVAVGPQLGPMELVFVAVAVLVPVLVPRATMEKVVVVLTDQVAVGVPMLVGLVTEIRAKAVATEVLVGAIGSFCGISRGNCEEKFAVDFVDWLC